MFEILKLEQWVSIATCVLGFLTFISILIHNLISNYKFKMVLVDRDKTLKLIREFQYLLSKTTKIQTHYSTMIIPDFLTSKEKLDILKELFKSMYISKEYIDPSIYQTLEKITGYLKICIDDLFSSDPKEKDFDRMNNTMNNKLSVYQTLFTVDFNKCSKILDKSIDKASSNKNNQNWKYSNKINYSEIDDFIKNMSYGNFLNKQKEIRTYEILLNPW